MSDPGTDESRARASTLDLTGAERHRFAAEFGALVEDYFTRISESAVFPATSAATLAERFDAPLPRAGEPLARTLEECRAIIAGSRHNGHPRFFGYVASPAAPVGAFASLLAAALNQNVTSWRSAPAATVVERTVVRWLAELVGYDGGAGGLLTSGGSMANLTALFIAHRTHTPNDPSHEGLWHAAPMTLYVSDQVHLSIPKAADLLGLGRKQVRVVSSDAGFRMDVSRLRKLIADDKEAGLRPFCVVGSAGTVSTGAVDPLAELAQVAAEYKLWFHVDGAYGALAALDKSKRQLFDGIERADSVSLDPHKWLYAPLDCGCLLFRDPQRARAAFGASEAQYIKVYEEQNEEAFAFWNYGVELSRPFRALKIWMMLRYYGADRLAASIAEDNALAGYWAGRIEASADFELLAPVTLGICCFRYLTPHAQLVLSAARTTEAEREALNAELDELNTRIMQAVQRGGRAYLSNAQLRGRFALRASITNFRTTRADIDTTLDVVRDAARKITQAETERS